MLENLTLIAVVAAVLWLVILVLYIRASRQQTDLQAEIEQLQARLGDADDDGF